MTGPIKIEVAGAVELCRESSAAANEALEIAAEFRRLGIVPRRRAALRVVEP